MSIPDLDIYCHSGPSARSRYSQLCDLPLCLAPGIVVVEWRDSIGMWQLCSRHAEMLEDQLVKFRQARERGGRP